jgi:hypothetical protein
MILSARGICSANGGIAFGQLGGWRLGVEGAISRTGSRNCLADAADAASVRNVNAPDITGGHQRVITVILGRRPSGFRSGLVHATAPFATVCDEPIGVPPTRVGVQLTGERWTREALSSWLSALELESDNYVACSASTWVHHRSPSPRRAGCCSPNNYSTRRAYL